MKNVAKFFVLFTALFSGLFSAGQAFAEIDNIEYGGSVFYDVDSFDGVYNAEETEIDVERDRISELRRAQLYLKLDLADNWSTKLQLGYSEKSSETKVKDAYVRYKGWGFADITVGQDKEPFSLGLMTSLKNSNAIERNIASQLKFIEKVRDEKFEFLSEDSMMQYSRAYQGKKFIKLIEDVVG